MNRDHFQKIRNLFHAACDLDAEEREKYLAETCAHDLDLRAEVDLLLAGDQEQIDIFEEGQLGVGQRLLRIQASREPARSSAPAPHGRYLPGAQIAGRYRIVSLLGVGGMGEVYRSDDMKLGHPVALKFLPSDLSNDVERLQYLLNEVRLSRQISHPNVCRVYDIGEADGIHFLSMEYIDGEDLCRLLKRIGHVPSAKGIDIARQLCRGLAAAHHQGVLHRDLKPANVMLDGRGQVRITDFGLARLAGDTATSKAVVGTPAYMAPEQISRGETTVQSDIYSLGLILYELFTGRAPNRARSPEEDRQPHFRMTHGLSSSVIDDVDPAIDHVILACLETDPVERPQSADAIRLALPGRDSLDEALAIGEMPSPELVAAAGTRQGLNWKTRLLMLAGILTGIFCIAILSTKSQKQMDFRADSLIRPDAARKLLESLGYREKAVDSTWGIYWNQDYFHYFQNNPDATRQWQQLTGGPPTAAAFWYRQHQQNLIPERGRGPYWSMFVLRDDPPVDQPGMVCLVLDGNGKLLEFRAIPTEAQILPSTEHADESSAWQAQLMTAAGIDSSNIETEQLNLEPKAFLPPQPFTADTWETWTSESGNLIIEAAAYRGLPVFFRLRPASQTRTRNVPRAFGLIFVTAVLGIFVTALILARRNWLAGYADIHSATRMFSFILIMSLLYWLFQAHHVFGKGEFLLIVETAARAVLRAVLICAAYLALEPFLRRLWPQTLISWNRLLRGRFRDPMVGRHILVGTIGGVAAQLIGSGGLLFGFDRQIALLSEPIVGIGSGPFNLRPLMGPLVALGQLCAELMVALVCAFVVCALFFYVLRCAVRKTWLATIVFVLFFSIRYLVDGDIHGAATIAVWCLMGLFLFLRFGVLSVAVAWFTWQVLGWPVTLNPASPNVDIGLMAHLLVAALACYGFVTAAGTKPVTRAGHEFNN